MKTLFAVVAAGFIFSTVLNAAPALTEISPCASIAAPVEHCAK